MSTSYIFLAGALFLFVIAIVILFMGKGKKDDKKVDKEFDENYAVNINDDITPFCFLIYFTANRIYLQSYSIKYIQNENIYSHIE